MMNRLAVFGIVDERLTLIGCEAACSPFPVMEVSPTTSSKADFFTAACRAIDLFDACQSSVIITLPWLGSAAFVIVDEARRTAPEIQREADRIEKLARKVKQ